MGTYNSLKEIDSAYRTLLRNYRTVLKQLKTDEPSPEEIESILDEQQTLMDNIDDSSQIDKKYREQSGEEFTERLKAIEELRQRIADEMQGYLNSIEKDLESLDQTTELMDQYQREGEASYHLDRTI